MNKKSDIVIMQTNDYSQFRSMDCNRPVCKSLVGKIAKSVKENDLLAYNPILVNDRYEVLDGQHRLEVCKMLNHPVYYIVKTDGQSTDTDCIKHLNINKKGWDIQDYFNFHLKNNAPLFKELKEFIERTGLTTRTAFFLFCNNECSMKNFKDGKIKKVDTNWSFVNRLISDCKFQPSSINKFLLRAILQILKERKRAFSKTQYKLFLDRLNTAITMSWNNEEKYKNLFQGKYHIKY